MLKRKDMLRTEWKSILEKEYRYAVFLSNGQRAVASVLRMKKVSAPTMIHREKGDITIANEGDFWLQIAVENSAVWITAMYDRYLSLQQIYFDITNGNNFNSLENPTFEDLFLDVVMDAEGELKTLDQEELEAAFVSGVITQEQYRRADESGKHLCAYLHHQRQELLDFCFEKLMELK